MSKIKALNLAASLIVVPPNFYFDLNRPITDDTSS